MRVRLALLAAMVLLIPAAPANAATTLTNAGFESGLSGWSGNGYTESGGRSGNRLTHWASAAYQWETRQTLTGLTNGSYTARAWVRSGGGQIAAYLALKNCGSAEQRATVPASDAWTQISVTLNVSGGNCTVSLFSNANAGNWASFDDITFGPSSTGGGSTIQIRGVDISTLKKSEDRGGVYRNSAGTQSDALTLLRSSGVNYARLKVWVNPADGYNNKARVLTMASRAKAQGMKLLVDFHYSDSWADPGKQNKPAAWASMSFSQLRQAVYDHTYDVLNALKAQGTTADMAQVGNEINDGMLWPDGRSSNWANLASLLTAGSQAVKAVSSSTQVMLHLAEGGNNSQHRWWFDQATSRGVPFDVIGVSHYVYWHGSVAPPVQPHRPRWAVRQAGRGRRDGVRLHAQPGRRRAEHLQLVVAAGRRVPGERAGPDGRVAGGLQRGQGGAERARARRLLLGADVDGGDRQRLGPDQPVVRQRLGEPGPLRLLRPSPARATGLHKPLTASSSTIDCSADRGAPAIGRGMPTASPCTKSTPYPRNRSIVAPSFTYSAAVRIPNARHICTSETTIA
jgi:arabinogalactan endo-1,4-beta-galactosidase